MPFMMDIEVLPGPAYYTSGFKHQLRPGARTTKLTTAMYTAWAVTCLPDVDGGSGKTLDGGWSPTRSLAVRNQTGSTHYYKAGGAKNDGRLYDLQLGFPGGTPGVVDKDTVVKGMEDFAQCAVEVARGKRLSKHTVLAMMRREMDVGAIQFDSETAGGILDFAHQLADKAGLT